MIIAVNIITDSSSIAQAKDLTLLLTDHDAGSKLSRAVAFSEFIGISIRFDSCAKFLIAKQVEILNIICIQRSSLSTRGAFCNGSQTVPSNSLGVFAIALNRIQNALLNTGFEKTFADIVPCKFRHICRPPLIINCKNIVM